MTLLLAAAAAAVWTLIAVALGWAMGRVGLEDEQ